MDERKTKQVILVRRDLKMPAGKMAAQVAHASLAVILNQMDTLESTQTELVHTLWMEKGGPIDLWVNRSFTKVCLGVDSLEDLEKYYAQASNSGQLCSRIVDEGRTFFNGIPTPTCVAIGPGFVEDIDAIVGHLKLY